jgi:phospholipid/cholesterol/gamma-HCH transport system ATP-binding protein
MGEPENTQGDASIRRVNGDTDNAADSRISLLRFEDVTVSFGDVKALRNLSFNVVKGETRIILGAAGSGKTVLLKTAMGLNPVTSGKVFLFNEDITDMPEQALFDARRKVGMLFQESALFDSMTVAQNVAYPLLNQRVGRMPRDKMLPAVRDSLRFVELEHTLTKYPSELSGGMRRRVAIARAVVTKPPLLLYDSPTAGLDPITAHTIMALIIKERDVDNTTALVVSHRYQDGNLVANFRYNSESGRLDPASVDPSGDSRTNTIFMVMREGTLVFEGKQSDLEASTDPYISKFVKHPEKDAA